ncbi:hypothetical protein DMENIID0001_157930 [Sergentomyia squamirostris]
MIRFIFLCAIFVTIQCDISSVREAHFLTNNFLPPVKDYKVNNDVVLIGKGSPQGRPKEFEGYDSILKNRGYLPPDHKSTPGPLYLPPSRPTVITTTTTPRSISMKPLPTIQYIPASSTMRPIPTRSYSYSPRPYTPTTTTIRGYNYETPSSKNNPFSF